MIGQKQTRQELMTLGKIGAISVANLDAQLVPFDGVIDACLVRNATTGVDGTGAPTQNVIYDILKNNVSVFTTTKINFTHATLGRGPNSYGDLVTLAPISVSKGDVITFSCTQILNGTSPTQPTEPTMILRISRLRGGKVPSTIITDATDEPL